MLFNSYIFIFLFLPAALLGWHLLNRARRYRAALAFLTAMSLWFYGYFNISYLALLLISVLLNHLLSLLLHHFETGAVPAAPGLRRLFLLAGVLLNLGIFFYFKYRDFFFENINSVFGTSFPLEGILLPLGISFFTFQQLSYTIDRAKGDCGHVPFLTYISYVTFFPQLIAGPIVLSSELIPQFEDESRRTFDPELFTDGCQRFILGLAKKVLLADVLAGPADYGFGFVYYMDAFSTILAVLCYAFELYFDFSGYCDMAVGLGAMFGVRLPENFLSPYKACTIREFWQRWHVTLQRFFTKYVYIPLGGSRKGKLRTALNILIVFSLSGLWHGAAWTYVSWGLINGLLILFDNLGILGVKPLPGKKKPKYFFRKKPLITIPRPLGNVITFLCFLFTLLFFRASSLTEALVLVRSLGTFLFPGYIFTTAAQFAPSELFMLRKVVSSAAPALSGPLSLAVLLAFLSFCGYLVFHGRDTREIIASRRRSKRFAFLLAFLLVWSVLSFSQVSTFLYFNF